jgi:GNAT superfamily N-acetyltransferase
MTSGDSLVVRRATSLDFPKVLELARRALEWTDDNGRFLEWKHLQNPFGESPMWVALEGERVVGFRALLRWDFVRPDGTTVGAARAVDTATDPDFQRRGIFTRLAQAAIQALPEAGIELIFNTPNDVSLPGYLKMGWREVGRLPVAVMPTTLRFLAVVPTARRPAGRWPIASNSGEEPSAVFADQPGIERLLSSLSRSEGFATRRSREFLSWRYGFADLGYRVVLHKDSPEHGLAIFRRRRRGRAVEGVLCELLVPHNDQTVADQLVTRVAALAGADYLIRVDHRLIAPGPFVRLPRLGRVLTCRPLTSIIAPPLPKWGLSMGDLELF